MLPSTFFFLPKCKELRRLIESLEDAICIHEKFRGILQSFCRVISMVSCRASQVLGVVSKKVTHQEQ